LRPRQPVRYVAGDLSPGDAAGRPAAAKRRDLDQIEFTEADVEALPLTTPRLTLHQLHRTALLP
jgi:hypothetical protein